MGLFDFFDKDKRRQRAIKKASARLTNAYMQGPDRMRGADTLLEFGTDEAIYGLLKRFTIRASNGVVDEEEKEQVLAMVVGLGEKAVPPIKRFIRREDQIYQALQALSTILPEDKVVQVIGEVLDEIGPDYMRNPERKLHMVQHLADIRGPETVRVLLPFLQDHDEGVRFQVIEGLRREGDEAAREPMLDAFCSEEESSLRIRKLILEVFEELGWKVKGFRGAVEALLPTGYVVEKSGKIKLRSAAIKAASTRQD